MFKPQDLYIPVSEEPGSYDDRTINFHKRTENLLEERIIIYVVPKKKRDICFIFFDITS